MVDAVRDNSLKSSNQLSSLLLLVTVVSHSISHLRKYSFFIFNHRFGKPLVIDLHDNPDLIDMCWKKLDEIKEGLSAAILDKSIMEEKV